MDNDLYLEYPPGFNDPQLYQYANFSFPHDQIMQYDYPNLVSWFFKKDYIIPYYIHLSNPNFKNNMNDILLFLKSNEQFDILGAGFLYLKGLIEKIENINDNPDMDVVNTALYIIDTTIPSNDKINQLRNNVKHYFETHTKEDFLIILNTILNVIQNIIIHVIRYVSIYMTFPIWFNHVFIKNIITNLKLLIDISPTLAVGIPKNYPIYLGTRLPIINALEEYANKIHNSQHVIHW